MNKINNINNKNILILKKKYKNYALKIKGIIKPIKKKWNKSYSIRNQNLFYLKKTLLVFYLYLAHKENLN